MAAKQNLRHFFCNETEFRTHFPEQVDVPAAAAAERCGHGLPGEVSYWDTTAERLPASGIGAGQMEEATRRALGSCRRVRGARVVIAAKH